jgi:DNA-binding transcriptional regulator YhcF (GntR family)
MVAAPYHRITADLRGRITSGELPAGARVPSTRQIVQQYGVAMATASKVLSVLRQEGLVQVRPGVGTIVRQPGAPEAELGRGAIVRVAIRIADGEGFDALSMRRVATELGSPVMSLYRHVPSKEELELAMRDTVFGEQPLPADPPTGWRARLELSGRTLWQLYRRHPWLARTTSLTRPYASPNQLPYSEWSLAALSGIGLDDQTIFLLHLSLFGFVHGSAASLESENREEATSGVTLDQWLYAREAETRALMTSGAFENSARIFLGQQLAFDLDALFEFGLARLLDGVQTLVSKAQDADR